MHAGALLDGGDDLVAVRGDAQAGRAHRGDRPHAVLLRLVDHARDRGGRALKGGVDDHALLREPLAEARQLCAVDDGAPASFEVTLADVELDRIGAGVDDGVALRFIVDQGRQGAGIAGVRVAAQAKFPDGTDDPSRILRLDGDGAGGFAVRNHVGEFSRAAADPVADPTLVDLDHANRTARLGECFDELVERVARAGQRRHREPQRLEHPCRFGRWKWKARLHDRGPLFEAVRVDLPQHLDVHQGIADLHVVAGAGEQIDLVALLHPRRRQRRQPRLRLPEAPTE